MRVNLPATDFSPLLPAADAAPKAPKAGGPSFASLHADSMAKLARVVTPSSGNGQDTTKVKDRTGTRPADSDSAPKNEKYRPVEGQAYEEIVSGRRNGMFVNRSGNARDGEAFVLVKRNGREFHVYGTGADRQVVPVGKGDKSSSTSATGGDLVVKGTTYRDVAGRAFDEIVSGPRNGMFVNRSGNARDGKAFVLVERGDHELHIYGSGRNRLVVRVVPPDARKDEKATPPVPTADARTAPTPVTATPPVTGTPSTGSSVVLG